MDWDWEILLCMNNVLDGTQSPDGVRIDSKILQGTDSPETENRILRADTSSAPDP